MTPVKIANKQEKTLYYTTDKTNFFYTYDVQSSNEANSERFYPPPGILYIVCTSSFE